jgi:hypothetical protein
VQDAQSIRFGNLFGRHPLTAQDAKSIRVGVLFAPPTPKLLGNMAQKLLSGVFGGLTPLSGRSRR